MVPFQPIDTFKTQWLLFYNTAFLPFAKRKIFSRTKVGVITLYRPLYVHWAISNQFSFHFLTCFHVVVFFRARFYAAEIASAIGYLHALSIIYRYYFTWLSNCYVIFIFAKTCPQHLLQTCFLIIGVNLYYVHFLVMFCYHLFRDLKPENILLDFRVSMFCFR